MTLGTDAAAAAATDPPLGVAGLPLNNGGGLTAFAGAGGKGACAMGGRATGEPPNAGGRGAGRGGGAGIMPFPGGRAGMLIRTVSRPDGFVPAAEVLGRGGKVIRTVSFFGSFESAISVPERS